MVNKNCVTWQKETTKERELDDASRVWVKEIETTWLDFDTRLDRIPE